MDYRLANIGKPCEVHYCSRLVLAKNMDNTRLINKIADFERSPLDRRPMATRKIVIADRF
jgi:hypothetical protein